MKQYKQEVVSNAHFRGGENSDNSLTDKDKKRIVLLQSYCSPSPMSNDFGVFQELQKAFDIKVVYKKATTVCPIYIKDIWRVSVQNRHLASPLNKCYVVLTYKIYRLRYLKFYS